MKKTKIMALLLSATLVFSGCGNMNNTAKGGLIGGGGGAALGAIIGGICQRAMGARSSPWCCPIPRPAGRAWSPRSCARPYMAWLSRTLRRRPIRA